MEPKILTKDIKLSFDFDTTVKLDENVEITFGVKSCEFGNYTFVVKDIQGDAVIENVRKIYTDGDRGNTAWNEATKQFVADDFLYAGFEIQYVIFTPKKVECFEILHHFQFSPSLIKMLNLYEFHERKIVLPGYENMPFKYTVMKERVNYGKLCIKNEYDCFIQGKKRDFVCEVNENDGIKMDISFIFDSSVKTTEMNQNPVMDESRPESTDSIEPAKPCSKLYVIMSNNKYSDVILISSDNIQIPSHRCFLANYSSIFDQICDVKEIPLKINVEDFSAETIKAALDFLYGKPESIKGKETDVFQFAKKYEIHGLIKSCISHFIESVNPSNVCELIEIAFTNNFEELKQKCKEIMVAQKSEIDYAKLQALPKDILLSVFCC